jgi:MFS family permease
LRTWSGRTFESLENRDFRILWMSMLLTMGGFQMQMIARGILVFDMTGSAKITAVVSMGFAPSMLAVSLFGGALGDRMDRRLIIQIAQGVNVLAAGVVIALLFTDQIHWIHMFFVSVAQGAMFAIQMPARQAAIPSLVGKDRVGNAVALNAMAMSLMNVAGPFLGGLIYGIGGPKAAYVVVSIMMAAGFLITAFIPHMYPSAAAKKETVIQNIVGGLKYLRGNSMVRTMLVFSVMMALLSMPFRMMIPVFAKELYGLEPEGVGILSMMIGIGGIAASVLAASLRKGQRRGWVLLSAGVVAGLSMLAMAIFPFYLVAIFFMTGVGFGETIRWGLGQAMMMEATADEYRSRMMSLLMMSFGVMPLAMLPLGYAVDAFGAEKALFGMTFLLLGATVLFIILSPRMRHLS